MLPIADDLTKPALYAQRQADFDRALNKVPDSVANAERIRSTACAVESDDKHVIYRYQRQRMALHIGAYCPGETLSLWNQELVPGLSWLTEPLSTPTVVTKAAQ